MTSKPVYVDKHASGIPDHSKLTLYTNHACPWAHRAHIALHALKIPYWEVIIDLSKPRDAEYLKVNPRGLVPSLDVDGEIITESAIVAQYLADRYEGLEPDSRQGPLERARINFFVDTFISKVGGHLGAAQYSTSQEAKEEAATKAIEQIVKELEPLLKNANPFFNGSPTLTLAEVQTGSFAIRVVSFARQGILPARVPKELEEKAPAFWKWANAVSKEESVNYIWDEEDVARRIKERIAKRKEEEDAKAKV